MPRRKILKPVPEEGPQWGPSYSIQDASRLSQVPPYILRYWESCKLLTPSYTTRGHRRYRQMDLDRLLKIKDLVYVKGMTVSGARKTLTEESRRKKATEELPLELATQSAAGALLAETKSVLKDLLQILK